jgi:hypothetical protein
MKNYILLAAFVSLLNACAPKKPYYDLSFNQPQPEGIKNLNEFPYSYRGTFVDSDSNVLTIGKTIVLFTSKYKFKIPKQEVDTSKDCSIEKNYLIEKNSKNKIPFILKNDTLYCVSYISDTLYDLHRDIVRKHKGNLILNKEDYDNLWSVSIISIKLNELKVRDFDSADLFEKLRKISNVEVVTDQTKKITIRRILKPTKKQFENILNYRDSLIINTYKREKKQNDSKQN